MIIPHKRLNPNALRGLIEEYVTRDGTPNLDESWVSDGITVESLGKENEREWWKAALPTGEQGFVRLRVSLSG